MKNRRFCPRSSSSKGKKQGSALLTALQQQASFLGTPAKTSSSSSSSDNLARGNGSIFSKINMTKSFHQQQLAGSGGGPTYYRKGSFTYQQQRYWWWPAWATPNDIITIAAMIVACCYLISDMTLMMNSTRRGAMNSVWVPYAVNGSNGTVIIKRIIQPSNRTNNKKAIAAATRRVKKATNRKPKTTDAARAASPFFDQMFAKTRHPEGAWSMWNRLDVLTPSLSWRLTRSSSCVWASFEPFDNQIPFNNDTEPHMCLYPLQDDIHVSGMIAQLGFWSQCNSLTKLFREWVKENPGHAEEDLIYVDVGANIGSCVMQMLYSTKAKLVIFEPHPLNLQKLTSTLIAQPMELRKRVALFPVGVGSRPAQSSIYMATNNRGNTIVGTTVKDPDSPGQKFAQAATIYIEALDDIFAVDKMNSSVIIPLMKMDIQGYECKALDGMRQLLLKHVEVLETEATPAFLEAQGCSVDKMTDRLTNGTRFNITMNAEMEIVAKKNHSLPLSPPPLPPAATVEPK